MTGAAIRGCAVLMLSLLVLAGCGARGGSEDQATRPSRGSAPAPSAVSADPSLVAKAKLARCPKVRPAPAGDKDPALPSITLPCLGAGPDVPLTGLRGPLVVNLWATWCEPCRAEAPLFQRLHAAAHERVRVVGVDTQDRDPDAALSFAIDRKLRYPSVYDVRGRTLAAARAGKGLPVTLFVDRAGRIVHRKIGPYTGYRQLTGDVRQHLEVRP